MPPRAPAPCATAGCPRTTTPSTTRCPAHQADHERQRGTTTARGYGHPHQRERARQLHAAAGRPCAHCGLPMQADQLLDLAHTDDRAGYRGMAHASCNRRDGGQRARG